MVCWASNGSFLSSIYPYIFSDIFLIYKKKFELEINSQFLDSFNTKNSWKKFKIDKTYKNLSLSNLAIGRRQFIIINRLNELKNENRIENKLRIYSRGKNEETLDIKNLTLKRLTNTSKIFLKNPIVTQNC